MKFNEIKLTQLVSLILKLKNNHLHYKFIENFLYICDREALNKWQKSITDSFYISTFYGPMVNTFTYIVCKKGFEIFPYFDKFISIGIGDYLMCFQDPGLSEFSKREIQLVEEVVYNFKFKDEEKFISSGLYNYEDHIGEIIDYCFDNFCELNKFLNKSFTYIDILRELGKSEEEIRIIEEENRKMVYFDSLFGIK